MDKHTVVYSCDEILLINKKKQTDETDQAPNIMQLQNIMQSVRNLTQKRTYCMNSFILRSRTSKAHLWYKNQNSSCFRVKLEVRVRIDWEETQENFESDDNLDLERGFSCPSIYIC